MGSVQKQSLSAAGITVRPCRTAKNSIFASPCSKPFGETTSPCRRRFSWWRSKPGGQVLGAFDSTGRMVGFTLALAGFHDGKPFLHSHMAAVLPELQNQKIGRMLKLAQREEALSRGIRLIEWTFDPLELRNAHFNIVRLGAVMERFIPNCYGVTKAPCMQVCRRIAWWRMAS